MITIDEVRGRAPESPEDVLALFRDESTLYAKLESYADAQRSLVTQDDPAPLLSLLAERQRLSVQLSDIGTKLAPVRRDWARLREHFSPSQRSQAEQLTRDVAGRLRRVIQRDEQDARLLSARKQTVAQALRTTHVAGEALLAYRGPAEGTRRASHLDEAS